MEFGIIGSSVWQQNLPLLECLTLDRDEKIDKLHQLKSSLEISELIYLATCNRVEFIYASTGKYSSSQIFYRLLDFFFSGGHAISFFPNDFYHYVGRDAITHLFRTVSSLESLVMGEAQIAGQFKNAYQEAIEAGLAGPFLSRLGDEALNVSKKIKRETEIGKGAQSMASLAFAELEKHLKKNKDAVIALVGAGEMTNKFAKYIRNANLGNILFVNRSLDKAEKLAAEFGGQAVALDKFKQSPANVGAIVSATASPDPIFGESFLALLHASETPVLCIDLAIPRDFAPEFAADEKVRLIDIPYLKARSNGNLRKKFVETSKANDILKQSVHQFLSDRMEISIKPIFRESFNESIELAQTALEDLFAKKVTSLSDEEKEAVLRLVTKLIGHSAFQPARKLSDHLAQMYSQMNLKDFVFPQKSAV
ncbi:MAG: glutamyl-tRNA reductase [candidate division Zixibacteria bacterium HGW-Zixibacteria-1]|nr:MAG: glutamyl-tRNA reductase [candidate division Zixibacteria bacterium HGW-Zixibacteria-1]